MAAKKIVHIIQNYVDLQKEDSGGISNVVRSIVMGGEAHGFRSVLYCGNRELGVRKSGPGSKEINPWVFQHVFDQAGNPAFGPTGELLEKLKREDGPYVAHIHSCFSAFTEAAMAYFAGRKIPFVFTPHGKFSPGLMGQKRFFKNLWLGAFARRRINQASRVVLSTQRESRLFGELGIRAKVSVISTGYHPIPPGPPSAKEGGRRRDTILFLGYLNPCKQPELLVRAYALSRSKGSFTLTIAGPDAFGHRRVIEEEVEKAGLKERVILYGPAYGEDKRRLFSSAACFCLPSTSEALPLVLMEALGEGVPLVISEECNFPEAADRGAALELGSFDPAYWAKAIDEVLLDGDRRDRMAAAATLLGREKTWPQMVGQWAALYGELLTHGGMTT